MKSITLALLLALGLVGCGSDDIASVPPIADAGLNGCNPDPTSWLRFQETVTVDQNDGTTCTATYTIDHAVNTFACDCSQVTACAQANMTLTAAGQACLQGGAQ